MKSKWYPFIFLGVVLLLLLVHVGLIFSGVLDMDLRVSLIADIVLFFIFSMGIPIIRFGLKKKERGFVGSFLVLTTLQMLLAMSTIAAFIFTKTIGYREMSIQFVLMFILILAIQSIILIKVVKELEKAN